MTELKKFDIPTHKSQSAEGAMQRYEEYWQEPFNGTADDVRHIGRQVPNAGFCQYRKPFGSPSRCITMLWLMRENNPSVNA